METVILDMMPMLIFCDGDQHKRIIRIKVRRGLRSEEFSVIKISFEP